MDYLEKIKDSEMVFVGIGEEFEENPEALECYNKLSEALEGKNYFIISLCMDDTIYDSKLNKDRIVKPLGGYTKKQCVDACTHDLYDIDMDICPKCGKELIFNNILAENYVEEGYLDKWELHKKWLSGTLNKKLLLLELGVNMRFVQIVRFPFEKLAMLNNKAELLRVNEKLWQVPHEIADKATAVKMSATEFLKSL